MSFLAQYTSYFNRCRQSSSSITRADVLEFLYLPFTWLHLFLALPPFYSRVMWWNGIKMMWHKSKYKAEEDIFLMIYFLLKKINSPFEDISQLALICFVNLSSCSQNNLVLLVNLFATSTVMLAISLVFGSDCRACTEYCRSETSLLKNVSASRISKILQEEKKNGKYHN